MNESQEEQLHKGLWEAQNLLERAKEAGADAERIDQLKGERDQLIRDAGATEGGLSMRVVMKTTDLSAEEIEKIRGDG
jgi:hypothetical protein